MFGNLENNDYFCSVITKMKRTYMISFKITMKKTLIISLLALLPLASNAEAVLVDELWYNLNNENKTAVVVASEDEPYTGAITIPPSVNYKNENYIVVSIGESAFEECDGLTGISISSNVESIELGAFFGCRWLQMVQIPNGVKSIGYAAFSQCDRLTYVYIPSSVTSIGEYAFDKCTSLNRIDCDILQPFDISNTVFNIPEGYDPQGYSVYAQASLIVPDGKKSAYQSKAGWSLFENIIEASDVGEGGKIGEIFKSDDIYYIIGANNTVSVTSVTSGEAKYAGHIEIPAQVQFNGKTYTVASIGSSAFETSSDLVSVTIANGVTSIGRQAFNGCGNMTSITIPRSVTLINSSAFNNCNRLASVYISDLAAWCTTNFKDILANPLKTARLFLAGSEVKDLVIPNSVTSISNFAFSGCKSLATLTIPNSVTSIGNSAFKSCTGLTTIQSEIEVPFELSSDVFSSNSDEKDVFTTAMLIVPSGKKTTYQDSEGWNMFINIVEVGEKGTVFRDNNISYKIGENNTVSVVAGNTEYTGAVEIPSQVEYIKKTYSVTSIAQSAFENSTGLTSITIPSSIKSIGLDAFEDCTGLTAVKITDLTAWCNMTFESHYSNPTYHARHLFVNDKEVTDLVIPNAIKSIGAFAFVNCSALKSITIPEDVTSIGVSAFYGCSGLTTLTIPKSVTSIGETGVYYGTRVFGGCTNLTSIQSLNTTPPTSKDGRLIDANYEKCVVWVPKGSLQAYQEAPGWRDFKNIKEIFDGDMNADGKLSKADVETLVAYIMGKAPEGFNENQADMNGDKKKNAADVVKLIDLVASYGLSVDPQPYFKDKIVSALELTLKNNRSEAIQITKCELYCNNDLISFKKYSSPFTLETGSNMLVSFNNLAEYASKTGFSVYWYYTTSDGTDYIFRYVVVTD